MKLLLILAETDLNRGDDRKAESTCAKHGTPQNGSTAMAGLHPAWA